MTTSLDRTRALLDQPPTPAVPGQLTIPPAAVADIEAALDDAQPGETTHDHAHRVATYLASSGWTITPTRSNP
ncbi:hypothetical protein [Streptomyces sp. NBC_01268]|uniref:hypothetical protein n=1 Tax=Streptomyces sp. NBC_01268 TaxID=2903806 RepID=UPI002E30DA19|nr:hypothetical protein [Streptomyces sp. NBC_01268]